MPDDILSRARSYLPAHHVMTLATAGPEGPWASAVFYALDGFDLLFLSAPGTRHARNIADSGRAAAAIHHETRRWEEIKGIQMEGAVRRLEGVEESAAVTYYERTFPSRDPTRPRKSPTP